MCIAIDSDHAGFALKEAVKVFVSVEDREILDLGTHSTDPVAQLPGARTVWRDYSDYAEAVRPPSTSSSCRRFRRPGGVRSPRAARASRHQCGDWPKHVTELLPLGLAPNHSPYF